MHRLEALLREHHNRPSREIHDLIRAEVEQQGEQRDDQTLLVIRLTEPNDLRSPLKMDETDASES